MNAMTSAEIQAALADAPGWALAEGAIEKSFEFPDYHHTMAFVNAVAWIAHAEDHHPDLALSYGRCVVRYNTHSANGITALDFENAEKVEALFLRT